MAPSKPNEPVELDDGSLVCRAHRQVICGECRFDFSFMREALEEQAKLTRSAKAVDDQDGENEEVEDAEAGDTAGLTDCLTRGKLRYKKDGELVVPEIKSFVPPTPTAVPQQLFPSQQRPDHQFPRFSNNRDILIYTDGAFLNNGKDDAAAGWGFVFHAPEPGLPKIGSVSGRLEDRGPSGQLHPQTSNRAELRAVIAALRFRVWFGDGWSRLIIATDSEYVTKGATEWVRAWGRNGWITQNKTPVKNRDLWEELLCQAIGYHKRGMEICFWRIPRAHNVKADRLAKAGAKLEQCGEFRGIIGLMV